MADRPASWRMPNAEQMETLARERARMGDSSTGLTLDQPPEEWWQNVLADPRAAGKPWLPVGQLRLSEVPREVLSNAYGVCAWSRFGKRTRSGFAARTRFGKTSGNVCSITAASNTQGVMNRMAVG